MAKPTRARAALRVWTLTTPLAALALVTVLTTVPATTAQAENTAKTQTSALNLLRQSATKPRPAARRVSTLGTGNYVCSPAGFGQRSRCHAN